MIGGRVQAGRLGIPRKGARLPDRIAHLQKRLCILNQTITRAVQTTTRDGFSDLALPGLAEQPVALETTKTEPVKEGRYARRVQSAPVESVGVILERAVVPEADQVSAKSVRAGLLLQALAPLGLLDQRFPFVVDRIRRLEDPLEGPVFFE